MNKKEFLAFIKENRGDTRIPNFIFNLMSSFANQLDEDEKITFQNFLQYLKQNILVLREQTPPIVWTHDDKENFKKLIPIGKSICLKYDTAQQETWEEKTSWKDKKMCGSSTILHDAALEGDLEFLKYLVQNGADINISEAISTAITPFRSLIYNFSTHSMKVSQLEKIIQTMLELGADIHYKDDQDWTALDYAINLKHLNWVEALLKHGVQFKYNNNNKIKDSSSKQIKLLLEQAHLVYPPKLITNNQTFHDLIQNNIPNMITPLSSIVVSYLFKNDFKTYGYFSQKDNQSPSKQLFLIAPEEPTEKSESKCSIQ